MSPDPYIEKAFFRLNQWRHLPAYRLEPRADVFFAAFLPELLQAKLGHQIREPIIPEFPIRRGTLYGKNVPGPNGSVKVDYLAVCEDDTSAYLVELKTDQSSRRTKQDEYLDEAVLAGVPSLVQGVLDIAAATSPLYLPKYMHLLYRLEALGWIELPNGLAREVCLENKPPEPGSMEGLKVLPKADTVNLGKLYIQPKAEAETACISFHEAAEFLAALDSPLGRTFAKHLLQWSDKAGQADPKELPLMHSSSPISDMC